MNRHVRTGLIAATLTLSTMTQVYAQSCPPEQPSDPASRGSQGHESTRPFDSGILRMNNSGRYGIHNLPYQQPDSGEQVLRTSVWLRSLTNPTETPEQDNPACVPQIERPLQSDDAGPPQPRVWVL